MLFLATRAPLLSHNSNLSRWREIGNSHYYFSYVCRQYIYIYAFSRRFYPKRLTYSGYTLFYQYVYYSISSITIVFSLI